MRASRRHIAPTTPALLGRDLLGAVALRARSGAHRALVPASFRGRPAIAVGGARHAPRTGSSDAAITGLAVAAACSAGLLLAAQWAGSAGVPLLPGLLGGDAAVAAPHAGGAASGGAQRSGQGRTAAPALSLRDLEAAQTPGFLLGSAGPAAAGGLRGDILLRPGSRASSGGLSAGTGRVASAPVGTTAAITRGPSVQGGAGDVGFGRGAQAAITPSLGAGTSTLPTGGRSGTPGELLSPPRVVETGGVPAAGAVQDPARTEHDITQPAAPVVHAAKPVTVPVKQAAKPVTTGAAPAVHAVQPATSSVKEAAKPVTHPVADTAKAATAPVTTGAKPAAPSVTGAAKAATSTATHVAKAATTGAAGAAKAATSTATRAAKAATTGATAATTTAAGAAKAATTTVRAPASSAGAARATTSVSAAAKASASSASSVTATKAASSATSTAASSVAASAGSAAATTSAATSAATGAAPKVPTTGLPATP